MHWLLFDILPTFFLINIRKLYYFLIDYIFYLQCLYIFNLEYKLFILLCLLDHIGLFGIQIRNAEPKLFLFDSIKWLYNIIIFSLPFEYIFDQVVLCFWLQIYIIDMNRWVLQLFRISMLVFIVLLFLLSLFEFIYIF